MKEDLMNKQGGGNHKAPKQKNVTQKFPSICVDNFFENPDSIVRYAEKLKKHPNKDGRWHGKRSELLWKIDDELNHAMILKIMSCFYDLTYQNVSWEISDLYFHEHPPLSKDYQNKGWIHADNIPSRPIEVAGVIYLTKGINPNTGTSLFNIKENEVAEEKQLFDREYAKHQMYKKDEIVNEAYYKTEIEKNEARFTETVTFANIYNRMILYDTNVYHRANSYYDKTKTRLTLVFFIGGLDVGKFPLARIQAGNANDFINHRVTS